MTANAPSFRTFPHHLLRPPRSNPTDHEVCLLVGYAPDGRPSPALHSLLEGFADQGVQCYLCLAVEDVTAPFDTSSLDAAEAILLRRNGGFDFSIWASALDLFPQVWGAKRIYFVNDSIIGPLGSFGKMLRQIRLSDADYIALTDSDQIIPHTQSYFFVLQSNALIAPQLRAFWQNIQSHPKKDHVINTYEVTISREIQSFGLRCQTLFSLDRLVPNEVIPRPFWGNPTLVLWDVLINSGFPFIKVELLASNPTRMDISTWPEEVIRNGGNPDLFRRQVAFHWQTRGHPDDWTRQTTFRWMFLRRLIGAKWYFRLRRLRFLRIRDQLRTARLRNNIRNSQARWPD
jgi:hypothetical protein